MCALPHCLLLVVPHSGRGYANVAVANLRTNMSTWTQEYRPTGTACLHGLEVCALVAMYSSGVLVEKKRGCMLIKCLQQDAPVSLPTHNVSLVNSLQKLGEKYLSYDSIGHGRSP